MGIWRCDELTSLVCRTNEIGIRMALGASPSDNQRVVILRGGSLVEVGIVKVTAGAFALTKLLSSLLYVVKPAEPAYFYRCRRDSRIASAAGLLHPLHVAPCASTPWSPCATSSDFSLRVVAHQKVAARSFAQLPRDIPRPRIYKRV